MTLRRLCLIGALLLPFLTGGAGLRAQGPSAESLFADASAKESAVRKALDVSAPAPTVLKAVRTVVSDFENVVRRYPASGYSDDALWRGAMLSRDAFNRFHESREATTAVRLLQSLRSQYPSSKFGKQIAAEISALGRAAASTPAPAPAPAPTPAATATTTAQPPPARPSPPPASLPVALPVAVPAAAAAAVPDAPIPAPPPPAKSGTATIKDIRRAVLGDVVRIVIELDSEVTFHDERLESPSRIFVDLPASRPIPALLDQTIRFDGDADLVRQVRLGRHPNQTTRVVLDAAGVSSYSVYPLYAPFRLVIDCTRVTPATGSLTRAVPPPAPLPTPPVAAPPVTPAPIAPAPQTASAPKATPPAAPPALAPRTLPARGVSTAPVRVPVVVPKEIVIPPLAARTVAKQRVRIPAMQPLQASALQAATTAATAATAALADAVPHIDTTTSVATAAPTIPPLPSSPAPAEAARNLTGGFSIARQLGLGVSRIVIDPGHGGHDPGTKGAGTTEAEIVLDIAQRLEALLQKVPGLEVVLTRRTDEFISLQERTAIANRENADLFLSIHANANNSKVVRGVETYFLNFASNLSAAAVAARENAASGQSMGALPDVVKTIALNNKLDESRDFATFVQREMIRNLRPANKTVKDLGVKQAPFVVLIGAAMPSVLAEIAFLTNEQEARLLKGNAYRQRIATALFDAVRKYQASLTTVPGRGPTALIR